MTSPSPTQPSPREALVDDGLPPDWLVRGTLSASQRGFLDAMVAMGEGFMRGEGRDEAVLRHAEPESLRALFAQPLPRDGQGLDRLREELAATVVAHSVDQHSPRYLAFPDVGASLAGLGADILGAFLNQNLIAVDRSAPAATFVEIQLLLWLRELVGFETWSLTGLPNLAALGAMWTPGGNLSNTIAIMTALHTRFPEIRKRGLAGLGRRPLIVQSREIAHFSYRNAAVALGLGEQGLLFCPARADHTTDPEALERTLDGAPEDGEPFVVVAVAGNCKTAGLDDLRRIREVCDRRGLWMHVDACHGGSLVFSERLRARHLAGLELADSIALDPHKGMFVTYPSSYLLVRDGATLAAFSRYPQRVLDPATFDLGLITPLLGSRGFQSLKLWMLMKHLGVSGLARAVEARQAVNQAIFAMLERTGLFVFLHDLDFYRVSFVFCPAPVRVRIRALATGHPERRAALGRLVDRFTVRFGEGLYRGGEVVFDNAAACDLDDRLGLGLTAPIAVMGMVAGHTSLASDDLSRVERAVKERGVELAAEMTRALDDELDVRRDPSPGPAGW